MRIAGLRGLSLIETLICSTLLCCCLGLVVLTLPTGFLGLKDSERRIFAASLLQRVLEEKRNLPLAALDAIGPQAQIVEEVENEGIQYTVFLQVLPHATAEYARRVRVTVDWRQHRRTVSLSQESVECRVRR
jgi:hypothetical protein